MMAETNKVHCHPRKLARSVAHAQFKFTGFDNVDKPYVYKGYVAPSYFSTHWKEEIVKFTRALDRYETVDLVRKKLKSDG